MSAIWTLREQQIPDLGQDRAIRPHYRSYTFDSHNDYAAEGYTELNAIDIAGDNYYHRADNPPYYLSVPHSISQLYARDTVAKKLQHINDRLREHDLELYIFDAWRPIEVQNYFHDVWFYNYVKTQHPQWSEEQIWREVELYWAKGAESSEAIDPLSPAPHSTGGAVDLTIRKKNTKEHLFMGTMFDDMVITSFTDHYEQYGTKDPEGENQNVSFSEAEARANRRLLFWMMKSEGFENNATEWWHYSWGDQMWALFSEAEGAFYSAMRLT